MEKKKTWITVLIVVVVVVALVAAIWAGNKGETKEEEKIQEDQTVETGNSSENTAPKDDAQVDEEGTPAEQQQNDANAEEEMVEGTENNY